MFNIFDKLYSLNKLNFVGKIDYWYYLEYVQYLNVLSYINFNAKIKYFKSLVGFGEKTTIDKKLLNMSNWNLKDGEIIVQNLSLISENLSFKEYQIFTKVFFNELYQVDYNYGILFNKINIPNLIKYDIINMSDITNNIKFVEYHNFISNMFEYIVSKLKDKKIFDKYIPLLIVQEDYLFMNWDFLLKNKYFTEENYEQIMGSYDINSLYTKYRVYSWLRYKYVNAYIDIITKFKKSLTSIKRFMNELNIKEDYDFLIANHWTTLMPSYKQEFDLKMSAWINRSLKYGFS